MVKITHNRNVLAWLVDSIDVSQEHYDMECTTDEERTRMVKWQKATLAIIVNGWNSTSTKLY